MAIQLTVFGASAPVRRWDFGQKRQQRDHWLRSSVQPNRVPLGTVCCRPRILSCNAGFTGGGKLSRDAHALTTSRIASSDDIRGYGTYPVCTVVNCVEDSYRGENRPPLAHKIGQDCDCFDGLQGGFWQPLLKQYARCTPRECTPGSFPSYPKQGHE